MSNKKLIPVVTVSGKTISRTNAVPLSGEYYEKWDRKVKTDRLDIVIATTKDPEGKPTNWRRLVSAGGRYDWCETTNQYEDVMSGEFQKVNFNGKEIWLTNEAAENLPYYYKSVEPGDWKGGLKSMRKVFYTNDKALPKTVRLCPLNGELIDSADINGSHQKMLFEKTYDYDNSGRYGNDCYNIMRGQYVGFNLGIYGEADNPMFPVAQKSGDKYYNENKELFNFPVSTYEKYLKGFSVGSEIEAFSGHIKENICLDLGIVPVKDGSLEGKSCEYITTVLREGILSRLYKIFTECNKTLAVNRSTALQYHIGGMEVTPEFVVAMYMAIYQVRNEFFNIIPPYRRSLEYIKIKKEFKDHCKELPCLNLFDEKINNAGQYNSFVDKAFRSILLFLNEGDMPKKIGEMRYQHKKEGRPKWEWTSRYYMVNFLPLLFENKKTLEFRTHSGTTNPVKAINFLLINIGLIKYVQNNIEKIIKNEVKIRLVDVIDDVYGEDAFLADYLREYIRERKNIHRDLYIQGSAYMYGNEFTGDTAFNFKLNNKSIYER